MEAGIIHLGIEAIDSEHAALTALFDSLHSLSHEDQDPAAFSEACGFLENRLRRHFTTEEQLMLANGYRDYGIHLIQHQSFLQFLEKARQELESSPSRFRERFPMALLYL
ncbi:MAG: hemerythrin family protein, partial [Magnetococcales bacterium]|nr:hemerythrin family protein [Magnetococcales bacterium]